MLPQAITSVCADKREEINNELNRIKQKAEVFIAKEYRLQL
jgi:hypothetical protein